MTFLFGGSGLVYWMVILVAAFSTIVLLCVVEVVTIFKGILFAQMVVSIVAGHTAVSRTTLTLCSCCCAVLSMMSCYLPEGALR